VLKKDGRDEYDSVHEWVNNGLCLVRWLDNKAVTLLSTYLGSLPTSKIVHKRNMSMLTVPVWLVHTMNMGGIDLFDMMCTKV
jgi:hypothetical protein